MQTPRGFSDTTKATKFPPTAKGNHTPAKPKLNSQTKSYSKSGSFSKKKIKDIL